MIDDREGFVGYVPQTAALARGLRLEETLFLIALRILYEQRVEETAIKDGGRAEVLLTEIWELIEERVRRSAPPIGRVKDMIRAFQRQGIVKLLENLPQNNAVLDIRPCIRFACLEKTVEDLERYVRGAAAAKGESDDGA